MKLLFDQNLSHRLPSLLADVWPDACHVREFGLERADDLTIWQFAKASNYTIVSKDADFYQHSLLEGHPPKVAWVRVGNCSTVQIADFLRSHAVDLIRFENDGDAAFLVLS